MAKHRPMQDPRNACNVCLMVAVRLLSRGWSDGALALHLMDSYDVGTLQLANDIVALAHQGLRAGEYLEGLSPNVPADESRIPTIPE